MYISHKKEEYENFERISILLLEKYKILDLLDFNKKNLILEIKNNLS